MISIDAAKEIILSSIHTLAPVDVAADVARGCVAAEAIIATEPVPSFANSSMDGFALRSGDTSDAKVDLRIVDVILAGASSQVTLGANEAARIMTGAPLPAGADCVEMIEEVVVDELNDTVTVRRRIEPGTFVRRTGDDISIGDLLIDVGDELHASRLGVLASQGIRSIRVIPRPRVTVLSTGNELARTNGPLEYGTIRDSNRPLLLSLLRDADVTAIDGGIVPDDYEEISQALSHAMTTSDAVITTGGVSVGDVDFVKSVIGELGGADAHSLQIAVRPGKPFAFGVIGSRRVPVFGLPGNPVSTRVSFELFVRPALRFLGGHVYTERMQTDAIADCALSRTRDGKTHMVHVNVALSSDGRVHVTSSMREGSHLLHAIASANAMASIPDGDGVRVGDRVRVLVLRTDELIAPQ